MRIHGSKQQREAVKRAPREQLEPVFKVCIFTNLLFLYGTKKHEESVDSRFEKILCASLLGPGYSWEYQMEG